MLAVTAPESEEQTADDFVRAIPGYSRTIRTKLNGCIDRAGRERLTAWIYEISPDPVTSDRISKALALMNELWASEPLLAPQSGTDDLHWACASYDEIGESPGGWNKSATGLEGALNEQAPYKLVLRAPLTTPERALAGIGQFGDGDRESFPDWVADNEGFTVDAAYPFVEDPSPDLMFGVTLSFTARKQGDEERERRRSAVAEIVKRVVASIQ